MDLQVQTINHPILHDLNLKLFMARADLLHPLASGNKIYKLEPNFKLAKERGVTQLLSFGGAFSNHIHALALMAKSYGFSCVGIIRGEQQYASNPTMQDAQSSGMHLEFINREEYQKRYDSDYLTKLQQRYPNALIIPEGGSSQAAIQGCANLAKEINIIYKSDIIAVPCGTGATLSGIICGLSKDQLAIGYSALRDKSLNKRVIKFIENENCKNKNYQIIEADYGGFAKLNLELLEFIFDWLDKTGILLDPIYTSKMCMRLVDQIKAGYFSNSTSITIVHSGGLQGWRGMKSRVVKLLGDDKWQLLQSHL